jgi:hypothetical protein
VDHYLGEKNRARDEFTAGIVDGVTRDGVITRYRTIEGGHVKTLKNIHGVHMKYTLSGVTPNREAAIAALRARGSATFFTIEEVQNFFKPFRAAA